MNTLIYWLGRAFIALLQALPLRAVARLGRAGGGLAFLLSARYRRVALDNLTLVFGREKSPAEIRAIARENFRRLGENFASAIKTSAMPWNQLKSHVEFIGFDRLPRGIGGAPPASVVGAIGHFGNFELYARVQNIRPDYQSATTYRAFNHEFANRLMQRVRNTSGCRYFERRTDGPQLRATMSQGGIMLGLLADQSSKGLRAPFLGRDCNTSLAPAVLALRYHADLYTAICYRVGLAQWRVEVGEIIPTHAAGQPRSSEDIMRDVNCALEAAVRRDPANWFWGHRRWKNIGRKKNKKSAATTQPAPA
jgi:lauroyl/myristoyl acyltransferase